jgi:hypothetical protein
MNFLCKVAVAWIFEKIFSLLNGIPLIGKFMGKIRNFISGILGPAIAEVHCRESGSNTVLDPKDLYDKKPPGGGFLSKFVKKLISAATSAVGSLAGFLFTVYAAEDWWGTKYGGPKALSEGEKNGAEWNQIWGWTPANYTDKQDSKVRVATYKSGTFHGQTKSSGVLGTGFFLYTAQSEFYYDCSGLNKWKDDKCNGDDLYDYTMYSMRWRARIVRYRGFGLNTLGSLLGDFVSGFLTNSGVVSWFKDKLGLPKLVGDSKLPDLLKGILINDGKNAKGPDLFGKAVNLVVSKAKGAVKLPRQGTTSLH